MLGSRLGYTDNISKMAWRLLDQIIRDSKHLLTQDHFKEVVSRSDNSYDKTESCDKTKYGHGEYPREMTQPSKLLETEEAYICR